MLPRFLKLSTQRQEVFIYLSLLPLFVHEIDKERFLKNKLCGARPTHSSSLLSKNCKVCFPFFCIFAVP